jgi:hypothetical protein
MHFYAWYLVHGDIRRHAWQQLHFFGAIAKRLCTGLQIRVGRFDSGSRLHLPFFRANNLDTPLSGRAPSVRLDSTARRKIYMK